MRTGIMSSVAPQWDLDQLIVAAKEHGFQALELRVDWGHAFGLELDSTKARRREARAKLADAGIAVSCLALSTRFAKATPEEREAAVADVARYSELAADLGSPLVRVFGGPIPEGRTMADLRDEVAAALGKAAARAADYGVTPCLETHDHFSDARDVAYVVAATAHPNVGVVWHPAHHVRLGVSVAEGYALLRPWVRHCHIAERLLPGQTPPASGPVPLGSGDPSVPETIRALHSGGFSGVLSWEWINGRVVQGKADLATAVDPRPHLAQYAAKLREYIAEIEG